jgi:hypothetical protein
MTKKKEETIIPGRYKGKIKDETMIASSNSKESDKISKNSERGKKSRAKGQRFELKVRQELENKMGWTVSKWTNTIDNEKNKIVPAKRKYNPFSKVMTIGTGFPDFVCFKSVDKKEDEETIDGTLIPNSKKENEKKTYEVIGLEVKGNGYLDQIEKGMCLWYLKNKIFSRILIAKKAKEGKSRENSGIEYIDFEVKYNKE